MVEQLAPDAIREPTPADTPATSLWERRLHAEWALLGRLAQLNPARLGGLDANDTSIRLTLHNTPALALSNATSASDLPLSVNHSLRIDFPRFFPAVPMELFLDQPVYHPNVHPETGFLCLWDRHKTSNTVEHALHKTVAILGWQLMNTEALHVMQPEALLADVAAVRARLCGSPLHGVTHESSLLPDPSASPRARRRRLS